MQLFGGYSPSQRVVELEQENRQLRKRIAEQDAEIALLKHTIQDVQMQLAQLQKMVFRKKRIPPDDASPTGGAEEPASRSASSYRRATPRMSEVTQTEEHTLEHCTHCGSQQLERLETRSLYVEDIPAVQKEVMHHRIGIYRCIECGETQSGRSIPRGQTVMLGPRVKARAVYLNYILQCSDTDIIRYLWNSYGLRISAGELHSIYRQAAQRLQPTYNGIKDQLNQQESTHLDETGWQVGKEKQYAWGRVSPTTPEVLIQIGSRGKGNAEDILQGFFGCLTTDCYAAYKHIPGMGHQVCWVHLLREAKEVAQSPYLTEEQSISAQNFHRTLQIMYHDLKLTLAEEFELSTRTAQQLQFQERITAINQLLPCDTAKKLKNIKLRTQEYTKELFTCLQYRTALPENNLAERSLRHLVLKRKRSFGSNTANGARIFATNFSVVYSLWKKFPNAFFPKLHAALMD